MKRIMIVAALFVAALTGCAATNQQAGMEKMDAPELVASSGDNFYVYAYEGRQYVVGSPASSEKFMQQPHLALTKTLLGAGPHGETVVFEVAKKDPELADRLIEAYQRTPFLVEKQGDNYAVYKYLGRLYVLGNADSIEMFAKQPIVPYAKTVLGAGPAGETVVFELDKKDPSYVERLMNQFKMM